MGFELKEKLKQMLPKYLEMLEDRGLTEKRGNGYWNCPFCHSGDKVKNTPAFHLTNNNTKYSCFSCGAKGDIFDLVEHMEGISFKNGVISEKEYNEKSEEYRKGLQESVKDVKNYEDALTDLYMKQLNLEVEAVEKTIDKWQEARHQQEKYWDYSKKLKGQQKSVDMLKAQIAALESVNIICRMCFNSWKTVKPYKLQRRNEICSSVNV